MPKRTLTLRSLDFVPVCFGWPGLDIYKGDTLLTQLGLDDIQELKKFLKKEFPKTIRKRKK